jgi:hypothetical protein
MWVSVLWRLQTNTKKFTGKEIATRAPCGKMFFFFSLPWCWLVWIRNINNSGSHTSWDGQPVSPLAHPSAYVGPSLSDIHVGRGQWHVCAKKTWPWYLSLLWPGWEASQHFCNPRSGFCAGSYAVSIPSSALRDILCPTSEKERWMTLSMFLDCSQVLAGKSKDTRSIVAAASQGAKSSMRRINAP